MQKKIINNISLVALLGVFSLLFSGCNHTASSMPVSTIQKSFKSDIAAGVVKSAVVKAAKSHGWNIVSDTRDSNALRLMKVFTTKKPFISGPWRRAARASVDNEVFVDVNIVNKSLKIGSAKENEKFLSRYNNRERFNQDLLKLEKSIYVKLLTEVL